MRPTLLLDPLGYIVVQGYCSSDAHDAYKIASKASTRAFSLYNDHNPIGLYAESPVNLPARPAYFEIGDCGFSQSEVHT